MTYRRIRLDAAEVGARERYNAIPADAPDAIAELAYEAAAADRDYWRRLHAMGEQRLRRARKP